MKKQKDWDLLRIFESVNKIKVKGTLNEGSGMTPVTNKSGEPMGYETHHDDSNDRTDFQDDDAPTPSIDSMGFDRVNWRDVYESIKANTYFYVHHQNNVERMSIFDITHDGSGYSQAIGIVDLELLIHSNLGNWSIGVTKDGTYSFAIFEDGMPSYEEFINAAKNAYANPPSPNKPDAEDRYKGHF